MTLPSRLRAAIGLAEGDLVEASLERGKIVLRPKLVIDRSQYPSADDEYTPQQRRIIEARLAEARKGPYHGPFRTAKGAIEFLHKEIKARKAGKRQQSPR